MAHSYIIDNVGPGARIVRHVEVTNDTGSFAHVSMYADGADIAHGTFTPLNGRGTNELTSWETVSPGSFDLQQGEQCRGQLGELRLGDRRRGQQRWQRRRHGRRAVRARFRDSGRASMHRPLCQLG